MKKILAFALTVLLVVGSILFSFWQRKKTPEEPEAVVWRMMEHSRWGNVQGYLECFTGSLRAQLETASREMTVARFSEYLKQSSARVKGIAVYDTQRPGDHQASLTVEYVYPDQNEKQRLGLRLEKGVWRIESTEVSQRIQPLIPYGKPVTETQ